MFSPTDVGLQYPLTWKNYHGRIVICSQDGRELFLMEMIRPSIEAKRWIEEWAKAICDKVRNGNKPVIIYEPTLESAIYAKLHSEDAVSSSPEKVENDILQKSIRILGLSHRSSKVLNKANVKTVEQLVSKSDLELLSYKNFGRTSLNEVKNKLKDQGLALNEK